VEHHAKIPAVFQHPLNLAASARILIEDYTPASPQDLPILALARCTLIRQGLIHDGNVDLEPAITLVAYGERTIQATMEILNEVLTPQMILVDPLDGLAETIVTALKIP
jgi:hypothetical protein